MALEASMGQGRPREREGFRGHLQLDDALVCPGLPVPEQLVRDRRQLRFPSHEMGVPVGHPPHAADELQVRRCILWGCSRGCDTTRFPVHCVEGGREPAAGASSNWTEWLGMQPSQRIRWEALFSVRSEPCTNPMHRYVTRTAADPKSYGKQPGHVLNL